MPSIPRLAPLALSLALALAACGGPSETKSLEEANTALAKNDRAAARIHLKSTLQANPKNAEARFLLGKLMLEAGEASNAALELRKAEDLGHPASVVVPLLARALVANGEARQAIAQYGQVRFDDPLSTAELKTTLAAAMAASGDGAGAQNALQDALQAMPTHADALLLSARLKAADGDVPAALALVDEVLARAPRNDRALMTRGDLLAGSDHAGAVKAWRAALQAQPNLAAAHRAIITALLLDKQVDEAATQQAAMAKAFPNLPDTRFMAAQIAFHKQDYTGAREQVEQVLKVLPDEPLTLQLAGLADYQLKNYTTAENFLARALKTQPNLPLARETLAQIYLRSGQPNKAVDLLKPLLDDPKASARQLALLAEGYSRSGDRDRADQILARARQAEPDNNAVRAVAALKKAERGDDKALAELEQLAAADSGARTDMAVLRTQLLRKNLPGALKAADAMVRKQPDKALPQVLRGRILLAQGDQAGALAAFKKAQALDPAYLPGAAALAQMDLLAKQPEQARERFEAVLKLDPKNARAVIALAELKARSGGAPAEVTALLQRAVKTDPAEPLARVALINHLLARGEPKDALTAARDAAAALPSNLQVMDALGVAQGAGGDQQQAVSTFTKLAALQPTSPKPQLRLAEAYMATRDLNNAAAAYRRALELRDDLLPAQRALAGIALAQERPQDALAIARTVQKQRPTEGVGQVIEGDAEAARKHWDAALSAYRAALAKDKSSDVASRLYRVLADADRMPEAERFASGWMAEHPKDGGFVFARGDVAIGKNRLAEAEAYYRKVLELLPDNPMAHNNIAWLMLKQGKAGALPHAEKATSLMPDQPPLLDTLALVLLAEGQTAKALEVQKRAVERAPDAPSLRLTLARIYLKTGDKGLARTELDKLAKLGAKFPQQNEVTELLKSV